MSSSEDEDIEEMKRLIREKQAKKKAAAAAAAATAAGGSPMSPTTSVASSATAGSYPWEPPPALPLLPPVPPGFAGAAVIASCSKPVPGKKECAGRNHLFKCRVVAGLEKFPAAELGLEPEVEDDGNGSGDSDENEAEMSVRAELGIQLYEKLGLEELRWRATNDDLREAYRKLCLKYHPDKVGRLGSEEEVAEATAVFREIQDAYETLTDLKKRRVYDSQDDFDDHIPPETLPEGEDFFETYVSAPPLCYTVHCMLCTAEVWCESLR